MAIAQKTCLKVVRKLEPRALKKKQKFGSKVFWLMKHQNLETKYGRTVALLYTFIATCCASSTYFVVHKYGLGGFFCMQFFSFSFIWMTI